MAKLRQLALPFRRSPVTLSGRRVRREARRRLGGYWSRSEHATLHVGAAAETAARLDLLRAAVRRCVIERSGRCSARAIAAFTATKEGRALQIRIERLAEQLKDLEVVLCG